MEQIKKKSQRTHAINEMLLKFTRNGNVKFIKQEIK